MVIYFKRVFVTGFILAGLILSSHLGLADENNKQISPTIAKARGLISKQNYKSAIKLLSKAQKEGEDTVSVGLMLSEAYGGRIDQVGMLKKMGLAKKLRKNMEHSLELSPDNLDALQALVEFHMQAPPIVGGDKKKAHTYADKITEKAPLRGHLLRAQIASAEKIFSACIFRKS